MKLLICAIMVKDEEERAIRTMRSMVNIVDQYVILDTGSTDNTVKMIEDFCRDNKKPLKLKISEFSNFSDSRNEMIKMCYGLGSFILLVDANAEILNGHVLRPFLKRIEHIRAQGVFGCKFRVDNDFGVKGRVSIFYKIGLIRNNCKDIFYQCPVHEYITSSSPGKYQTNNGLESTDFCIYQDRLKDKSSTSRYEYDIKMLQTYLKNNSYDTRSMRYLAQTYYNMQDFQNSYETAKNLIKLIEDKPIKKYDDNLFTSYMLCARSLYQLHNDKDFFKFYLKAYKYVQLLFDYTQPLYELAVKYNEIKNYQLAFIYIKKVCDGPIPQLHVKELSIDYEIYKKKRWELLLQLAKIKNIPDSDPICKRAYLELYGDDNMKSIKIGTGINLQNIEKQLSHLSKEAKENALRQIQELINK